MKILQIGPYNFLNEITSDLEGINWKFFDSNNFSDMTKLTRFIKYFDYIIVDPQVFLLFSLEDFNLLQQHIPSHILISDFKSIQGLDGKQIKQIRQMLPIQMDLSDKNQVVANLQKFFYKKYISNRIHSRDFIVFEKYRPFVRFYGNSHFTLDGFFGKEYTQVGSWKYSVIPDRRRMLEFWPEFEADSSVEIKIKFTVFGQNERILAVYEYTKEQVENLLIYEPGAIFISITLHMRGVGKVHIGKISHRSSRAEFGCFLIGGEQITDTKRQAVYCYTEAGDLKPPLTVYFSGYRTLDGFEGLKMMRDLGKPFILFADQRLEGGAFYRGSNELELKIRDKIKDTLALFDFSDEQLILSGLSMGTYGALYYSSFFAPQAVIIGKPIISLEEVVKNSPLLRPDEFRTALDFRSYFSVNDLKDFDMGFKKTFYPNISNNTTFYIAYMKNDDYDPETINIFSKKVRNYNGRIVSKGFLGRHNDDSYSVNRWFLRRYKEVLEKEFDDGR